MSPPRMAWRFWRVREGDVLEGISRSRAMRQEWPTSRVTATTACTQVPGHEAPAPWCMCGLYCVTDPEDLVDYLLLQANLSLARRPSMPLVAARVRLFGAEQRPYPWPFGDPPSTVRVGEAQIVGPLALWPHRRPELHQLLRARYRRPVLVSKTESYVEWVETLPDLLQPRQLSRA